MVTGIILAVILVLLMGNRLIRKLFVERNRAIAQEGKEQRKATEKIRKWYGKIHKVLGILFVCVIAIHLIMTLQLIHQRPVIMYILGFFMLGLGIVEVVLYLSRRKNPKWLKYHRIVSYCLLVCMLGHALVGIISLTNYKNQVAALEIENVDLTGFEDGSYQGECNVGYIYALVSVEIKNEKIVKVDLLEHRTERGQKAEIIPEEIVEQQQINVDAVSGATNSSKVIEQAVRNAVMDAAQ